MKKLKIGTLFTRLHIGGDENRVLTFAHHYDQRRFEHRLIVMVNPDAESEKKLGPIFYRYQQLGVHCHFLGENLRSTEQSMPPPLGVLRDMRRVVRVSLKLASYLKRHQIDVLDARMAHAIPIAILAGRLSGAAVVATEYYDTFWDSTPWKYLRGPLFSQLDALICDSDACLKRILHWAPSQTQGVVIRNGIEIPQSSLSRDAVRRDLDIPKGARVIAQVSRLVPSKGHRTLLRAAEHLLRDRPDVHVLIVGYAVGGSHYKEELEALAQRLGIDAQVHIVSYPGPIADIWQAVDVHVHASEMDSAPIAIHESMALGIPAVVTTVGGVPELVEEEVSALLVPPGDRNALCAALGRVLDDEALASRLGDGARRRYHQFHEPEWMATQHCELFAAVHRRRSEKQGQGLRGAKHA